MDIKLPFSLINLFPCHSKYTEVHFSGSSKLNSWMEGGSHLPHLHVPPPPPAVQGERQSAILCFLAIYSYRACKQALLWYPVVRGWERGSHTTKVPWESLLAGSLFWRVLYNAEEAVVCLHTIMWSICFQGCFASMWAGCLISSF